MSELTFVRAMYTVMLIILIRMLVSDSALWLVVIQAGCVGFWQWRMKELTRES